MARLTKSRIEAATLLLSNRVAIDLSVRGVPEDTKQNWSHSVKFSPADAKFTSISGSQIWAMVFDANANPKSLPALSRTRCKYLQRCTIYGSTDPSLAAGAMPLLQHEAAAVAFSYEVNRLDNLEVVKWDCSHWRQSDPKLCLLWHMGRFEHDVRFVTATRSLNA